MTWRPYRSGFIAENKWRAMRDGTKGKLIDFGKNVELPISDLMNELLDFIDDVVDELGTRTEVEYVQNIIKEGNYMLPRDNGYSIEMKEQSVKTYSYPNGDYWKSNK